ncbi:succinate dehydrogenase cytochrome b subunit [Xanthocytophaga agilis]|uniref:Succinate dehydrogenase cytochrome b subunit n=1 Tax=Xanthocytophaga agilis TaxID=3048010 RepID=A0AAE3RBA6_9BACT|nr:succinate dehydrogenase cytochrome b subunit [Xanthocytophaga agilis]MDJ1504939.1 succinate dehydrogenase cytochrome b subunit [Xanthocytophaga agilis]
MNWLVNALTSTIGRKVLMALSGLFLIIFLVVHLVGNLQLLKSDGGVAFNTYAKFMGHNPLIQTVSILNFAFILTHIFVSLFLTIRNRKARPQGYAYVNNSSTWSSRNMGILGTIILVFLVVHLVNFWGRMKLTDFGIGSYVEHDATQDYLDLYTTTKAAFQEWWLVVLYVVSMIALAFHLSHGFQSAFRTLGVNHPKYTPFLKGLGLAFSIIVPAGFAIIPVYMFLQG